jgi:DNA polymerase-3 subunit epsilon
MRQIVLDTETTGLEVTQGHRIIEIGCVELVDRRITGSTYQTYINPDREIDQAAEKAHGITTSYLEDKPRFAEISGALIDYLEGAELIIHNADFDAGFLDAELKLIRPDFPGIGSICSVLDTLALARQLHPGQRCSLDALCKRYEIDNSSRVLHGAMLDSQILAEVYLVMTGGQTSLLPELDSGSLSTAKNNNQSLAGVQTKTKVIYPDQNELDAHNEWIKKLEQDSDEEPLWR